MSDVVRDIQQALTALGAEEVEVAETLRREGCTGVREEGSACPVFHYLDRRFPDAVSEVDDLVHLRSGVAEVDSVRVPGPVWEFIAAFDGGAYDELAATS
jgi:hypothetical protein